MSPSPANVQPKTVACCVLVSVTFGLSGAVKDDPSFLALLMFVDRIVGTRVLVVVCIFVLLKRDDYSIMFAMQGIFHCTI